MQLYAVQTVLLLADMAHFHPARPADDFLRHKLARGLLRTLEPIYTPGPVSNATLEHVVPCSVLARGRLGSAAARDLHNVFPTSGQLNSARSSLRFDEVAPRAVAALVEPEALGLLPVGHGNYVDRRRRVFCPRPDSRGVVARAVLHMCRAWGCAAESVVCGGERTLWRWHAEHPPRAAERLHNYVVLRCQNTTNPFVSNHTDPFRALLEALATRP
jgi:endonuclease I